jgi:hypothetical protein
MKLKLLRRKLIRPPYREHVSGGEVRSGNCWLRSLINRLILKVTSIVEPPFS